MPTNTTQRDILRSQDENNWHSVETIALLAGIAGLFHDFGKANVLFQQGLQGQGKHINPIGMSGFHYVYFKLLLNRKMIFNGSQP